MKTAIVPSLLESVKENIKDYYLLVFFYTFNTILFKNLYNFMLVKMNFVHNNRKQTPSKTKKPKSKISLNLTIRHTVLK